MIVGAAAPRPCCSACADHKQPVGSRLSAEALRDPHALKMGALASGQTMGRFGVFKGDVDALKRSINPSMLATDAAVQTCAALGAAERNAWREFFAAWKAFHDEETPLIVGVGRRYDEAIAYREQLVGWQAQLRPTCSIPGPPAGAGTESSDSANIASAVRWGTVGVVAIALVYGVHTLVKL